MILLAWGTIGIDDRILYGREGFTILYKLPYGSTELAFRLPTHTKADWVTSKVSSTLNIPQVNRPAGELIRNTLMKPIGTPPLRELAAGKATAVILISDMSRLCPSWLFLEELLDELNAGGLPDSGIRIIVALGMHRRHTGDELKSLVGEAVYRRVQVLNHSSRAEDCVMVGSTSRGTPVAINRHVVEAGLRIATGNLEPHRLAGISGGVKALVPGVAAEATIVANHSLSHQWHCKPGHPDNPIRLDLEEAHAFVPIDFLFNVIVTPERELLAAFAGHVIEAHRAAVEKVRELFFHSAAKQYPLVIAAAGGKPKDLQLYQAVKSLQNAADFTRPGGTILLAAECPEMLGNGLLQYWLETKGSRETIVRELKQSFQLGPHKLEHIDAVLQKHSVYLYSAIPGSLVQLIGFREVTDFQQTIEELTLPLQGETVGVMPFSSVTFADV